VFASGYLHGEAVVSVSVWRNIDVERCRCRCIRRISSSAVGKLMVRGARQASKVYEEDGIEEDGCCGRGVTYWNKQQSCRSL
jgi:hypothetical protein